jgi:DNA-binding LacI/PurR family transcriptional regulator
LIMPCITNPFFMELAKAVETEAYRQGFKLILCEAGQSIEKEEEFIRTLSLHDISGIITATGNYINQYNKPGFVVVSIDKKIAADIVNIGSDNQKGGALAISHLAECGCKKILFIRQEKDIDALIDRQNGALDMAGKLGMEVGLLAVPEANSEWVLDENHKILREYDGIFAWNDMTAISALRGSPSSPRTNGNSFFLRSGPSSFSGKNGRSPESPPTWRKSASCFLTRRFTNFSSTMWISSWLRVRIAATPRS